MQQFGAFQATELYCPNCRTARPVRERLLLVLPSGELHEYLCTECGASLGTRETTGTPAPPPPAPKPRRPPAQRRLLR